MRTEEYVSTVAELALSQKGQPQTHCSICQIWGLVQQRVYQSRVRDVEELKQRLLDIWHGLEQSAVDSATDG